MAVNMASEVVELIDNHDPQTEITWSHVAEINHIYDMLYAVRRHMTGEEL